MSDKKEKKSFLDKIPFLQKLKNIKYIEYIIIGIFAIVLVLIYTSFSKTSNNNNVTNSSFTAEDYAHYLEDKLINVISKINGVGNVGVMITVDGGMKYEYATESEEITTSTQGSNATNNKTTKTEEVVIVNINGKNQPLIIKESYPDIIGVLVVATGANNAQVKLNISRAIETILNVDDSKIEIMVGT